VRRGCILLPGNSHPLARGVGEVLGGDYWIDHDQLRNQQKNDGVAEDEEEDIRIDETILVYYYLPKTFCFFIAIQWKKKMVKKKFSHGKKKQTLRSNIYIQMEVSSPDKIFRKIRTTVSLYEENDDTTTNNVYRINSSPSDSDSQLLMNPPSHSNEPLLREDPSRFCLFPIQYHDIWKAYKDHKNAFWTAEEIDFTSDKEDWEKLTDNERYFIEHILAFFAGSDGIVLENLMKNFCSEVQIPEVRCFYGFQAMMENIHSEVYSLMIDSFVQDPKRKEKLFDAINTIPCVEKKATWALKWINDKNNSFARRLFAFGIVEGLFFSGAFCAIFWLKERGLMVQTLGKSNEWIARDESLHTEFAILLYTRHLVEKLEEVEAHNIMHQAVQIEEEFICDSLTVQLIGMNPDQMKQYVRYCADRLLNQFGYKKIYYDKNPFPFMEKISMDGKTNFFEQRVSEYSLAGGGTDSTTMFVLEDLENELF